MPKGMKKDAKAILQTLNERCLLEFGCDLKGATKKQIYKTVCLTVRDILIEKKYNNYVYSSLVF